MTINELLTILCAVQKQDSHVYFDFCRCVPTTVDSWRGIYAEPALGWQPTGYSGDAAVQHPPTVASLINELKEALGRTYTGWKGGEYSYNGNETLHIDNSGDCTDTEIVRVEVNKWDQVVLHTAKE